MDGGGPAGAGGPSRPDPCWHVWGAPPCVLLCAAERAMQGTKAHEAQALDTAPCLASGLAGAEFCQAGGGQVAVGGELG